MGEQPMSEQLQTATVRQELLDKLAALDTKLSQRIAALQPKLTRRKQIEDAFFRVVYVFIILVGISVALSVAVTIIYDYWARDYPDYNTTFPADQVFSPEQEQVLRRADEVLGRAIETGEDADRLLSFLEGASILIGGALAAAAIYGFRNAGEIRKELHAEIEELASARNELRAEVKALRGETLATVQATRKDLRDEIHAEYGRLLQLRDVIDERLDQLEQSQGTMQTQMRAEAAENQRRIEDEVDQLRQTTIDLLEAHQHLRSGHHRQAYEAAQRVLARDPENPEALYMSGWLKMQHLPGFDLDDGIAELRHAVALAPYRPAISAALGVLIRRKARHAPAGSAERRDLFNEAEGLLRIALAANNELLDLSSESLYGPIAGLHRDQGDIDGAIKAYKEAVRVTPGSAYPRGNLAALYLQRHTKDGDQETLDESIRHFRRTHELAEMRLVFQPQDYWLLMDIAMSQTILAQYPPDHSTIAAQLKIAGERLKEAMDLQPTAEMLRTSLSGWTFLRAACPAEWTAIRASLDDAIVQIEQIADAQDTAAQKAAAKENKSDAS
jgi:tetratricopeptide (TPR) repeat protein